MFNPSTGSGGTTVNPFVYTVGDLLPLSTAIVNLPIIDIGSENIIFSGEITKPGESGLYDDLTADWVDDTAWTHIFNIGSVANYIHQTGTGPFTGKFDYAVTGTDIKEGTQLNLSGSISVNVMSITGDGTGDDSVQISTNLAAETYPIVSAQNILFGGSNGMQSTYGYYDGTYAYPKDDWDIAISSPIDYDFSKIKICSGMSTGIGEVPVGHFAKFAFSKDNGSTFYYYNGTDWVTISPLTKSEWYTKGNLFAAGWFTDSLGDQIDDTAYQAFGFTDPGVSIVLAVAIYATTDTITYIRYFHMEYESNDSYQLLEHNNLTAGMMGPKLHIQRLTSDGTTSSSVKLFNTDYSDTLYDIKLKAWIIGDNLSYPPIEE